jgi:hypothetical protein
MIFNDSYCVRHVIHIEPLVLEPIVHYVDQITITGVDSFQMTGESCM